MLQMQYITALKKTCCKTHPVFKKNYFHFIPNLSTDVTITCKATHSNCNFTFRITAFVSQSAVLSTTTSSESIMFRHSSNCVSLYNKKTN